MDCMRDGFEEGKVLDGRFVTVAPLNHGSFGMVFSAKDNVTGADVAVKCITKADAVRDHPSCPAAIATDERSEELAIHSRLSLHPNIVNYIHHFQTAAHQYMVLELCGNGDLYEAIRVGRGPLETEHVRAFMLELVDAVEHLHANGIYHRDIKPENIFLTAAGEMKLGDFGLATTERWSTEFGVGSDRYMAPEQYDSGAWGHGYCPATADIWAIGIVLLNVLFQRNPFATPTLKDKLFTDFASDRMSLFDVFPTMSHDTFNVIEHCLDNNPANRSLGAVRKALRAVESFTTDDETLDDFCTEPNDVATVATAAREPLRTPSVTSANTSGDSFPFSTGLLRSPQKPLRQLSTIQDEEHDPFPSSAHSDWQYVDTDEASLSSNRDSGLGMSYKSSNDAKSISSFNSFPNTSVASLPISFTKPNAKLYSPYSGNGHGLSKSWSDMVDEDEEMEEQLRSSFDSGMQIDRVSTAKPSTPQLRTIAEDDSRSATPRQTNARPASPLKKVGDSEKADTELPKRSSSFLDKWSALGNFRRAKQDTSSAVATPTPQKTKYTDALSSFTPFSSSKKQKPQEKISEPTPRWRQNSPIRLLSTTMNKSQGWDRKNSPTGASHPWELDNNWREHKSPEIKAKSHATQPPEARKSKTNFLDSEFDSDKSAPDGDLHFDLDGDLEWAKK